MKKRLITLIMATALALLVVGCIEISGIEYIEFDTYPKTTYLIGEDLEIFEVAYKMKGEEPVKTLSSDDSQVKKVGFSTDVAGTFTMRVYIEGYEDVSINFVYTVVNSMIDTLFAGGYGTEEEPYEIETAQQLSNIRFSMDSHYVLNNDIDLEGVTWDPIGETHEVSCGDGCISIVPDDPFTGSLFGNDFKIMNLSSGGYIEKFGLFDTLEDATISNLELTNVDIDGHYVGGLAYSLFANTTLSDIRVSGTINTTFRAGGIANNAVNNDSGDVLRLTNVRNDADIISLRDSDTYTVLGGLIGESTHDEIYITDSYNYGDITHVYSTSTYTIAGQLIGQMALYVNHEITDSTGYGMITGNNTTNKAFYGYAYTDATTVSVDPDWYTTSDTKDGKLIGHIKSGDLTKLKFYTTNAGTPELTPEVNFKPQG
jgi:hypothetical protein